MTEDIVASRRTVKEIGNHLSISNKFEIEADKLIQLLLVNKIHEIDFDFLGGDGVCTIRLFADWGENAAASQQCTESATLHFEVIRKIECS